MGVQCAECGEPILGAVNRCWRCGATFPVRTSATGLPPVRRAPLPRQLAEFTSAPASNAGNSASASQVPSGTSPGDAAPEESPVSPVSRLTEAAGDSAQASGSAPVGAATTGGTLHNEGATANHLVSQTSVDRPSQSMAGDSVASTRKPSSPFAANTRTMSGGVGRRDDAYAASSARRAVVVQRPMMQQYPVNAAARGGAIAALVVGILAVIFSFWTSAALLVALIGMVMGLWGLYSDRRGMAVVGILLCCIAIAVGGFELVKWLYGMMNPNQPLFFGGM